MFARPDPLRIIDIPSTLRLLRIVEWANYFMLVTGGAYLLGAVTALFSGDASEKIAVAAFSIPMCFCLWIAWKNANILTSIVRPSFVAALVIFSLAQLIIVLGNWRAFADATASKALGAGILVAILSLVAVLPAIFILFIVRSIRIEGPGVSLKRFLSRAFQPVNPLPAGYRPKPGNRAKAWGWLLGAIAWFMGISFIPDNFTNAGTWQIAVPGYWLLIYSRKHFQPTLASLRAADSRPSVVFLRSFKDDAVANKSNPSTDWYDFSLESRLAAHFTQTLGPVIAVASPGDAEIHLGAVRESLSDSRWQTTVSSWMIESALILIVAGDTEGLDWELRHAVTHGYLNKVLILFPEPKRETGWQKFKRVVSRTPNPRYADASTRLAGLDRAFRGTIWSKGLGELMEESQSDWHAPARLRTILLDPGGVVVAVRSKSPARNYFHLGALIARDLQINPALASGSSAVSSRPAGVPWGWLGAFAVVWFLLLAAGLFWKYAPTTTLAALGLVRPLDSSIHVRATGKLHVGNLRFADAATAPSRGASYDPGETVRFEYSAAGNSTTPDGSARILVDVFVKDSTGATVSGHLTQTSDIKNGTLGIKGFAQIPTADGALDGDYTIHANIRDLIGGDEIEFEPVFHVRSSHHWRNPPVEVPVTASGQLRIGSIAFVDHRHGSPRSSDFQPGGEINLAYEFVGFGRDQSNKTDVSMETLVLMPTGEQGTPPYKGAFRQTDAPAASVGEGWFNLKLNPDAPPGTYTIVVRMRDAVSGDTIEARPQFRVLRR